MTDNMDDANLYYDETSPDDMSLTTREKFASRILAGLAANPELLHLDPESCAKIAIKHADALITEIAKETKK